LEKKEWDTKYNMVKFGFIGALIFAVLILVLAVFGIMLNNSRIYQEEIDDLYYSSETETSFCKALGFDSANHYYTGGVIQCRKRIDDFWYTPYEVDKNIYRKWVEIQHATKADVDELLGRD